MALSKIQDEMLALSGNACKAWVNFNGTGTVAIRDSYNVSSITDNGVGDYTVNFTKDMSDVNYTAAGMGGGAASINYALSPITLAVDSFRCLLQSSNSGADVDSANIHVIIFGN